MTTSNSEGLIRSLLAEKRLSIRSIAIVANVSRNTVRRYARNEPAPQPVRTEAGEFLVQRVEVVTQIYAQCECRCPPTKRCLKEKFGVDIPLRMLQRFCKPIREEIRRKECLEEPIERFETAPGQHLQIDFGEKDVLLNGEWVHLHFFVCKLGYSRRVFAKAYLAETQDAWLDGIESAFVYFGGIPYCIVCDNASSLVRDHDASDESQRFTERFYHFLKYWNIKGIATKVRHPQSKGKVEAGVKYLKVNAVVGVDKPSLEAWNAWLETWCRTESDERKLNTLFEGPYTPSARWYAEKAALRPCDKPRIAGVFFESRKVTREGLIRVDNRYYRVNDELIGLKVEIQHDASTIIVRRGAKEIAKLDKAKDAFNPVQQSESTKDIQQEAVDKQIKKLEADSHWQAMQNSPDALNRDGKAYDANIGWVSDEKEEDEQ